MNYPAYHFRVIFQHVNSRGRLMAETVIHMSLEAATPEIAEENLNYILRKINNKIVEYLPRS